MQTTFHHIDCHNFAPLDVVKGICHVKKEIVFADADSCDQFKQLPRCKHCAKYTPNTGDLLGVCEASASRPMTYPELAAITCEWFAWREP